MVISSASTFKCAMTVTVRRFKTNYRGKEDPLDCSRNGKKTPDKYSRSCTFVLLYIHRATMSEVLMLGPLGRSPIPACTAIVLRSPHQSSHQSTTTTMLQS